MKTIEFLKANGMNFSVLTDAFGILVKQYDEGLVVLNYNQIESPKSEPVVQECRGLILDLYGNVVSRSFDRFFNLGEMPDTQEHLVPEQATFFEKVDGSLIKIYNFKNVWYVSTRGTAFAESSVGGFDLTFKQMVMKALNIEDEAEFQCKANEILEPSYTYIFEIVGQENRVVTRYDWTSLVYLGARNVDGKYGEERHSFQAQKLGARTAKKMRFSTMKECVDYTATLPNLEEGFVVWQDGRPVCKVKSPAYLVAHRIRGEGLNPTRICELVMMQEHEEYLAYFENDRNMFVPYIEAYDKILEEIVEVYDSVADIESQKDFAIAIKDVSFKNILFSARKNGTSPKHELAEARMAFKVELLKNYV